MANFDDAKFCLLNYFFRCVTFVLQAVTSGRYQVFDTDGKNE
jgi:hypothetical protein